MNSLSGPSVIDGYGVALSFMGRRLCHYLLQEVDTGSSVW